MTKSTMSGREKTLIRNVNRSPCPILKKDPETPCWPGGWVDGFPKPGTIPRPAFTPYTLELARNEGIYAVYVDCGEGLEVWSRCIFVIPREDEDTTEEAKP